MNKFILTLLMLVLGISLLSYSCNTKKCNCNTKRSTDSLVTFKYFELFGNDVLVDTITDFLKIKQIHENTIFEYSNSKFGKETFCVNFLACKGYKIFRNDTTDLLYVEKYKIVMQPQNDSLDIYRFISNPLSIDGDQYLFFSPQLGIIMKKSTTWPTFSVLSEHFLAQKNDIVSQLTSILLFKEYLAVALKVPMEEPPPPPALR